VSRQHDECSGSQTLIYTPQYRKRVTDVSKDRDYLILTLKTAEKPVTDRQTDRQFSTPED
jgi:hypothetical protein